MRIPSLIYMALLAGLACAAGCSAPGKVATISGRAEIRGGYIAVRAFGELKPGYYHGDEEKAREDAYRLAQSRCYDEMRTVLESIHAELGDSDWDGERIDFLRESKPVYEETGCWLEMKIPLNGSRSAAELLGFGKLCVGR